MAPSGKLRRSENLPDEGLVWARERLPSTSERKGGNQTLAANCTKVSFAESRLSSPDTSYSGNLLQLSDRETP